MVTLTNTYNSAYHDHSDVVPYMGVNELMLYQRLAKYLLTLVAYLLSSRCQCLPYEVTNWERN
jgi:hypothetical protein